MLLLTSPALLPAFQSDHIRIGVLSHRGDIATERTWKPTADYLTAALPGFDFSVVPLDFSAVDSAVADKQVDFVLVNPSIYVNLEVRHRVSRIATMRNRSGKRETNVFGGVIFTLRSNEAIRTLKDLQGRSLMAVDQTSLGGFQMAWGELKHHGINLLEDLSDLRFGGIHDAVVNAVTRGDVDAGTVRTDILERMSDAGLIDLGAYRILNPQQDPSFPYLRSTPLYPEWPFSKLRHTSSALAQQVAIALLGMPADHPAARAGAYSGLDGSTRLSIRARAAREAAATPVRQAHTVHAGRSHQALLARCPTRIGLAADHDPADPVGDAPEQTPEPCNTIGGVVVFRDLTERKEATDRIRRHRTELAHVVRLSTLGEMASGIAHELNQPLTAISTSARACVRMLESGRSVHEQCSDVMDRIADQAERAGKVIHQIRHFVRKEEPDIRPVRLSGMFDTVAGLLRQDVDRAGVSLTLERADDAQWVLAQEIQIEQVIINLARNAIEAMLESKGQRRLVITAHRLDSDQVEIRVRDTGAGLEPRIAERLFDPFVTTKPQGLGLGLSISQSTVEAHRAKVMEKLEAKTLSDLMRMVLLVKLKT